MTKNEFIELLREFFSDSFIEKLWVDRPNDNPDKEQLLRSAKMLAASSVFPAKFRADGTRSKDKILNKEEFIGVLNRYNYPEKVKQGLWDAMGHESPTEQVLVQTCECMREDMEKLEVAMRPGSSSKELIDFLRAIKDDEIIITKIRFYEICKIMKVPKAVNTFIWDNIKDKKLSERKVKVLIATLTSIDEVKNKFDILSVVEADLGEDLIKGFEEIKKRDFRQEEKWFLPTKAQDN